MQRTYVLLDFENVQPDDLGLLHGEQYRVKVFHGPHQTKLDIGIVRALQPLGAHVEYMQRDKGGKNALDFLMAFCIGRLVEEHLGRTAPTREQVRFVVISKDGGFESLLAHVRSLGFAANRAATIREGMAVGGLPGDPQLRVGAPATPSGSAEPLAVARPVPAPPTQAPKPAPAKSATGAKPATAAAQAQRKTAAPKAKTARPAITASGEKPGPDAVEKVIAHLREHAKGRPTKRNALERHVVTILGGKVSSDAACSLVADLERAGVVEISEKQIKYKLPKAEK